MSERTLFCSEIYTGRLIRLEVHEVALTDGRKSRREIVRHPDVATVVAQLPDGRFLFVRQYRKAVEEHLLELPAGCLEDGEEPAQCAAREVREETGYKVKRLRLLGSVYSSPGFCDEKIWMFHACLDDGGQGAQRLDVDEAVACVALTGSEADRAMNAGTIRDAKSLAAWCLFKQMPADCDEVAP